MESPLTRGRRALLAILQRTTEREVAARCRVARQTVSDWSRGWSKPRRDARLALARAYDIAPSAWDESAARDWRGK